MHIVVISHSYPTNKTIDFIVKLQEKINCFNSIGINEFNSIENTITETSIKGSFLNIFRTY